MERWLHQRATHTRTVAAAIGLLLIGSMSLQADPNTLRPKLRNAAPNVESLSPDLPDEARAWMKEFAIEREEIQRLADREIALRNSRLISRLKVLQDELTRAGKLDEAVAVRDEVRRRAEESADAIDDPGSMSKYAGEIGLTLAVRVTGRKSGTVYGTGFYTADSMLATACVHAGVLKPDETRVVLVTMVHRDEPHVASTRNGVSSCAWGAYSASYTVARWTPERAAEFELIPEGSVRIPRVEEPKFDSPSFDSNEARPAAVLDLDIDKVAEPADNLRSIKSGSAIFIRWGNAWYHGMLIEAMSPNDALVHYQGWGKQWDETVDRSRVRVPMSPRETVAPRAPQNEPETPAAPPGAPATDVRDPAAPQATPSVKPPSVEPRSAAPQPVRKPRGRLRMKRPSSDETA